ncbi:MAG: C_GCAxxG_C_C family protein [Candidatus Electrothrix sp. ATG1]|nr:C_GCAxxG_C_C family protein [Candidatus Electrothrix sp. ATG1]
MAAHCSLTIDPWRWFGAIGRETGKATGQNMDVQENAQQLFRQGYACSQAILIAFSEQVGLDTETAKKIASPFGGGMGRLRKTCGVLTGSFMVLGMKYGNTAPNDMEAKLYTYQLVQELTKRFKEKHGETECRELLLQHVSEQEVTKREHHRKICDEFVRDGARILAEILEREGLGQR